VSTEEQAQVIDGSLDSQQHRLKGFVDLKNQQEGKWGKVHEFYIDDGYSAKDTRRPAYQRMLADVRRGKIDLILVADLSRLSRNIPDFCLLLQDLEKHRAKFLSMKEQFDTSTPVGEMMIYNMINLAQFERKQTSERVAMNFHSRAMRGLLNGGNPILGYDKDPTNPGKLVVNAEEAVAARKIFRIYLDCGSLQQTAAILNATDINPKVAPGRKSRHALKGNWTLGSVRNVLTNRAYIGEREINKLKQNEDQDALKPWQRYQLVKGSWPGIVEREDFEAVQKLIGENLKKERTRFAKGGVRHFLLSGVLRCGTCGMALIGQTSHGKYSTHRYYGHKISVAEKITCEIKRVRADETEAAVAGHLSEMLFRAGHLDIVEKNLAKALGVAKRDLSAESARIEKELSVNDAAIDSAFSLHAVSTANPAVLKLVQEKLERLAERKKHLVSLLENSREDSERSEAAAGFKVSLAERVKDFNAGWKKATPSNKKRLVRRLIDKLIVTADGISAYYVLAEPKTIMASSNKKRAPEYSSGALHNSLPYPDTRQTLSSGLASSESVPSLRNGGGGGNRTLVRSNSAAPLYTFSL